MPNYPALLEQDPTEPLDLSELQFSMTERFKTAASTAYGHYTLNTAVNNLANITPNKDIPSSQPITAEDAANIEVERPGLKVPVGLPKFIGGMMQSTYDNDKYMNLVAQAHPKNMGRIAALGAWAANMTGGLFGGSADPKMWITGFGVGAVGKVAAEAIAAKALARFGASELYGSSAARVSTLIAQSAGEGAGFGLGAQTSTEIAEQEKRGNLQEPHEYIQSLQNIGESALFGAMLGVGFKTIGLGLFGHRVEIAPEAKVTILPDEYPTTHDRYATMEHARQGAEQHAADVADTGISYEYGYYESALGETILTKRNKGGEITRPAQYEQQGGLFNRPAFKNMPAAVKDYIGKIYKPWSRDADITMKEEGTGQILNGAGKPNVDPILKQGMVDEGANFREGMRSGGVDVEALDRSLAEAQEQITSEMFAEHFAEKFEEPVKASPITTGLLVETYDNGSQFVSHIDEGDTVKVLKNNKEGRATIVGATTKENGINGGVDLIKTAMQEAQKRGLTLASDTVVTPNMMKVYRRLEKEGYKIKFNPDVTERIGEGGSIKGKKVIQSNDGITPVVEFLGEPEIKTPTNSRQLRQAELVQQYMLAQSMRDHINDTHEPLTQAEVEAYSEHLKSSGMPDNGYTTAVPDEGFTVDDYLQEFNDKQIAELADKFKGDKEVIDELERAQQKVKQQPKFTKMAQEMTDCILKGAV